MSKQCQICGRGPVAGRSIKRRGLAKKKGGVGRRITGVSRRVFNINLKKVKAKIGTTVKTMRVCTQCIRAGKVKKAK